VTASDGTGVVDRQSGAFVLRQPETGIIKVGYVGDYPKLLFECRTDWQKFWPDSIYASGDTIVLMQIRDSNQEAFGEHFDNCWIFRCDPKDAARWLKQECRVDGYGICIDPFSGRLLCSSYWSLPTTLFFVDLTSGRRVDAGWAHGDFAFVLEHDLFGDAVKADRTGARASASPNKSVGG
jgi:hypothetical protein